MGKKTPERRYDLLITNGIVYNGLGVPGEPAAVAVKGDRIVKIAPSIRPSLSRRVIDVRGMAVAPGFIDPHSHTDIELLVNPKAESKIRQGVTTEIGGNCGFTYFPLSGECLELKKRFLKDKFEIDLDWNDITGFFKRLERRGVALNYATLLGHGSLREEVLGTVDREPTWDELAWMRSIIRENMEKGAFGLSTGLIYTPGCFAQPPEITELCREVAQYGGIYTTHMRDEGDYLMEAVEEAIAVARGAKVGLQISHLKLTYPRNWVKIHAVLSRISEVKAEGVDILADRYPYTATSTFLNVFFPRWIKQGSHSEYLARLVDPVIEPELRDYVKKMEEKIGSWENIMICSVLTDKNRSLTGQTIHDAAARAGKDPYAFIRDLLIEENDQVGMINFSLNEENFKRIMCHPLVVIGSDGWALAPYGELGKDKPHPRSYGTFPRLLGRYVRDEKIMSLAHAIEKMTSITAMRFGLVGRGQLREHYFADIVVFDPDRVEDVATWSEPNQYPRGIEYVIVNGRVVIDQGEHTGSLPGRVLKKCELNPHPRWAMPPSA
jgi:N-acyl-D-amino-acid deacylase